MSRKSLILYQHARLLGKETTAEKLQSFWLKLAVKNVQIARGNESLVNYEEKQLAEAPSRRMLSEKIIYCRGAESANAICYSEKSFVGGD